MIISLGHVLFGLIIKFLLEISSGLLVLLIFRHQIIHVGLGLSKLHLVHALASVPMQESLSSEHSCELLRNTLEDLLDGSGVSDKGGGHLQASGRNVTHGSLDVVGDPFNKVGAVLVLDVQHLFVHLLH